jgi:hypothetical protein
MNWQTGQTGPFRTAVAWCGREWLPVAWCGSVRWRLAPRCAAAPQWLPSCARARRGSRKWTCKLVPRATATAGLRTTSVLGQHSPGAAYSNPTPLRGACMPPGPCHAQTGGLNTHAPSVEHPCMPFMVGGWGTVLGRLAGGRPHRLWEPEGDWGLGCGGPPGESGRRMHVHEAEADVDRAHGSWLVGTVDV